MAKDKMRANVFYGVNDIRVDEVERPRATSNGQNPPSSSAGVQQYR